MYNNLTFKECKIYSFLRWCAGWKADYGAQLGLRSLTMTCANTTDSSDVISSTIPKSHRGSFRSDNKGKHIVNNSFTCRNQPFPVPSAKTKTGSSVNCCFRCWHLNIYLSDERSSSSTFSNRSKPAASHISTILLIYSSWNIAATLQLTASHTKAESPRFAVVSLPVL